MSTPIEDITEPLITALGLAGGDWPRDKERLIIEAMESWRQLGVESEREACAALADNPYQDAVGRKIAVAIRARVT